jgi:dipeptidyl aminopeptidase/acylaminoacyl peptidase
MPLPSLIPREVLFGNPERMDPQVSPDGRQLAFIAPHDGVLNVWIGTRDGDDPRPVTRDRDRGIRTYAWAHDGKHLLYEQDRGGDENWRLYKVNPEGNVTTDLTPFDGVQVQIVAHDKRHPHELLIGMNKEDPRRHDVYHVDLRTNQLRLVAKNPGDVVGWTTDTNLVVRGATVTMPDGGIEFRVRESDDASWRRLVAWGPDDALNSGPIAFTLDGHAVYLLDSRDVNAARLVRQRLTGDDPEVLAADERYDVGGVMLHPDARKVQLVSFIKARTEHVILDESIRSNVATIRTLAHGDFGVTDRDHADRTWIVSFTADTAPPSYYAFDRSARQGRFLFTARPRLADYALAGMRPIQFTSRDGLEIHGYLTLPPGVAPRALPMVLNVHGGPWARDTWGYDPEAQWLANRGYAVLQVNFRGSTGYGKRFLNAGDKEWGGRMHDDLVDGVRWAIEQGVADRDRIGIYGGSYGGYAALVGATFTPDLFRCAVDIVGPSNLITFIETIPPYWSAYLSMLHRRVGDPETETDFLKSRSPLFHVDNIRIPLLIAQGANDPRVKQSEAEQIVAALREKGIDHEYLLFPDEGHGFAKPENRLRFYAAAERFLARHLGGRAEA